MVGERLRRGVLALTVLAAGWASGASAAQAPPSVYAEYHPSFADMMTAGVQPRHTKLGLALRARNWTYATYELSELRGAFNRIARSIPSYEGKDTAQFVAMIADPIAKLQMAIAAKDPGRADAAYAEVTETCNMCHGASERAYIAIRTPAASMFPDQDFAPKR